MTTSMTTEKERKIKSIHRQREEEIVCSDDGFGRIEWRGFVYEDCPAANRRRLFFCR